MNPMENGAALRVKEKLINNLVPQYFDSTAKFPMKTKQRIYAAKGGWIQKATASIKRRGTKGKCTPITKPGCTGRAKALALTFKKIGRDRKSA